MYSFLHVANIVFESSLLFFCSAKGEFLHPSYCRDGFKVGTGAVVSIVTLVSGEGESSKVALLSLAGYHALFFSVQLKRLLHDGIDSCSTWEHLATLVNVLLLCQSLYFILLVQRLVQLDTLIGLFSAIFTLVSQPSLLSTTLKAVPVLLMSLRLARLEEKDQFDRLVALGLVVSSLADFAIDFEFLVGVGLFLLAHLAYVAAFVSESKEWALVSKGIPIFVYSGSLFSIALAPRLASSPLLLPIFIYCLVLTVMVWRASAIPYNYGLTMSIGAIAFALSDSLLAVDKFTSPISNARYPILLLYYLGQGLLTRGVLMRKEVKKEE